MSEPKINLGIDLGTTYSCVAFCKDNKPEIIRSDSGENIVPSVVRIEGPKNFVVGTLAKNHAAKNPENTINNIKRLMGMLANDESIKGDLDAFSFKTETRNGELKVVIQMPEGNYEDYYPEEISAMILHHLLQMAKNQFGDKIGKTVITVPAYFNEPQRQATKDAAKIAGLEVEQILDEPTAAAFYHLGRQTITTDEEFNLLVFDLGGGTFDVTVLTRFNDVCDVKSINGDNHLGGEDFTDELLNYVVNNYPSSPVELDKGKSLKLKAFCETAKKELSELDETHLDLSGVFPDGPDDYLITRSIFEEINKENFQRLWDCVLKGLKEAELEPKDIKEIVLVGGSTRIPKIQNMLKDAFSHIKKLTTDLNPDESVALGAALKATKLAAKDKKDASKICTLWDVTSHSLGIETSGGHFSKIIPKNMTVPAAEEKKYVTTDDNQESARFSVFEGENVIARKNRFLGMFILDGIPPLPKGEVSFTVKLKKDVNKILVVSAVCDANKKEKELKISLEGKKLTEEEIRRLRGKLGFELQEE